MNRPNVILIVLDTLRYDFSQGLDTLKELGFIKYDNTYSTSSWTLPSHVSMFTGLYPKFHGVHEYYGVNDLVDDYSRLVREALGKYDNLLSIFKDEGYKTINFSENLFISRIFNFNFDESYISFLQPPGIFLKEEEFERSYTLYKIFKTSKGKFIKYLLKGDLNDIKVIGKRIIYKINKRLHDHLIKPKIVYKGFSSLLKIIDKEVKNSSPYFLFINLVEAHEPYSYEVIKKFEDFYDYNFLKSVFNGEASKETITHYKNLYPLHAGTAVNCANKLIRKIMKSSQNSLIIVTADHGNLIGERKKVSHGYYLDDSLVKVPFYVKYPSYVKPIVFNGVNSLISVYSLIRYVLYKENVFQERKFVLAESYGPQHSIKTITKFFPDMDKSELRKHYAHKVKIITSDRKSFIYNIDSATVENSDSEIDNKNYQDILEIIKSWD